ncbi:Leucine rich repeat N-terminal domain [Musa troglodytarum]|uniref:Leucine rich repeat N-terminal domain n=1 Tax=Musa troglodytarum TaxID=320322 RepID=A0A9E7HCQ5_9LILI|nr:Leucine rich repeat N-terminal domain [Musa troglodytarum]
MGLSHDKLAGHIPSQIGELVSPSNLSLSDNLLTGTIPESMAELRRLQYLDLSSNQLLSPSPGSFRKAFQLWRPSTCPTTSLAWGIFVSQPQRNAHNIIFRIYNLMS